MQSRLYGAPVAPKLVYLADPAAELYRAFHALSFCLIVASRGGGGQAGKASKAGKE
jgi:hypothetical protein